MLNETYTTHLEQSLRTSLHEWATKSDALVQANMATVAHDIVALMGDTLQKADRLREQQPVSPTRGGPFILPNSTSYTNAPGGTELVHSFLARIASHLAFLGIREEDVKTILSIPLADLPYCSRTEGPCRITETCNTIRTVNLRVLYGVLKTICDSLEDLGENTDFFRNISNGLWSRQMGFEMCFRQTCDPHPEQQKGTILGKFMDDQ